MTAPAAIPATPTVPGDPADIAAVATAVTGCPAVASLHAGPLGTYLPGGRVPGVRLDDKSAHVVVDLAYPATVRDLETQVRAALEPLVSVPVDIEVADVILPEDRAAADDVNLPAPQQPAPVSPTPANTYGGSA